MIEIKNCIIKFECTKKWDTLTTTDDEKIRFCDQCNRNIIYCDNEQELKEASEKGECVAVKLVQPKPIIPFLMTITLVYG